MSQYLTELGHGKEQDYVNNKIRQISLDTTLAVNIFPQHLKL